MFISKDNGGLLISKSLLVIGVDIRVLFILIIYRALLELNKNSLKFNTFSILLQFSSLESLTIGG